MNHSNKQKKLIWRKMNMIIKERLKRVLEEAGYEESDVTRFIKGNNDKSGWRFENQMRDSRPFPLNLENKIYLFLDTERIPYSRDYLNGKEDNNGDDGKITSKNREHKITFVDENAKARKVNEYGALNKSECMSNYKNNNCNRQAINSRLKMLGWKKTLLNKWLHDTNLSRLSNILSGNAKFLTEEDQKNLAYFCAGTVEKLCTGTYRDDKIDLSIGFRPGSVKCPYRINPEVAEILTEQETNMLLKSCGIPKVFYQEMIKGNITLPEQAAEIIIEKFNFITDSNYKIAEEGSFIISINQVATKKVEKPEIIENSAETTVETDTIDKSIRETANLIKSIREEYEQTNNEKSINKSDVNTDSRINEYSKFTSVINVKLENLVNLVDSLSVDELDKLSKYAAALSAAKKAKEELLME